MSMLRELEVLSDDFKTEALFNPVRAYHNAKYEYHWLKSMASSGLHKRYTKQLAKTSSYKHMDKLVKNNFRPKDELHHDVTRARLHAKIAKHAALKQYHDTMVGHHLDKMFPEDKVRIEPQLYPRKN
jgi:hypothetical protein